MKIVYATIAIHPTYHQISRKLVESYLKFVKDSTLLILTDDSSFYNQFPQDNIIVLEDKSLVTGIPSVNLNIKYKLLQIANNYNPTHICLFDCDAYFAEQVNNEWFSTLPEGINVCVGDEGPPTKIQNPAIRRKILTLDPDVNKVYKYFREGTILYTINNKFVSFCEEWGKLYQKVLEDKLTFTSEIFEINLASERSGFPINDLKIHSLRGAIWMYERLDGRSDGRIAIAPALR